MLSLFLVKELDRLGRNFMDTPKELQYFFSYIADKEREKIQCRVIEGLKNAKDKGLKLGRFTKSLPKEFNKYYSKWKNKEVTGVEFAKLLNISRATLYRHIKEYEL